MDLAKVNYQELAEPPVSISRQLLNEANSRDLTKGRAKFNELFFKGGEIELREDVPDTWREDAYRYAKILIGSWNPKHEHKEAVCAMLFEETLKL